MPTTIALRTPTRGTAKRTGASRDTESLVIPMHSAGLSGKRHGPSRDTESLVISTANETRTKTMDFSQFDFSQSDRKSSPRRPSTSGSTSSTPNFSKRKTSSKGSRDDTYSPFPLTAPVNHAAPLKWPSSETKSAPTTPKSLPLRKSSSYSILTSPRSARPQRSAMTPEPGIGMAFGSPSTTNLATPTSGNSAGVRSTWVHSNDSSDQWSTKMSRRPSRWLNLGNLFGKGKKRSESAPHNFYQVQPEPVRTPPRRESQKDAHKEMRRDSHRGTQKDFHRDFYKDFHKDFHRDVHSSARSVRSVKSQVGGHSPIMPGPEVPEKPYKAPVQPAPKPKPEAAPKKPKPAIRRSQTMPAIELQQPAFAMPSIKVDAKVESGPAAIQEEVPIPTVIEEEEENGVVSKEQLDQARRDAKRDRIEKESRDKVEKMEKVDKIEKVSKMDQLKEEPEAEAPAQEKVEVEVEEAPPVPKVSIVSSLAPQLELDIPTIRMERFSIMFGSLMDINDPKRASVVQSRRQATLDKIKAVNDAAEKEDEDKNLEVEKSSSRSTLRPASKVSPMRSSFAGELDRTFGIAFSEAEPVPAPPADVSDPTPKKATALAATVESVKERVRTPPSKVSRESYVDSRRMTDPFKPGASHLILDDADSDDENPSGSKHQRRSKVRASGPSAAKTNSPALEPNHSVSGSTSSSDMSTASTWSNAPWSSAPSSEFSFTSTVRANSPQPSPKSNATNASTAKASVSKSSDTKSTPSRSGSPKSNSTTPTATTPKAKAAYMPTSSSTSTPTNIPSPGISPHTHITPGSSPLVPTVATTTTTITAGSPKFETPKRTSSRSPDNVRISSALPPTIETFIPTLEPFDFGSLSPPEDDETEKRLTNAAAVSIARQISISREQRKLLVPLGNSTPTTPLAKELSPVLVRSDSIDIPPPLRIEKISKMKAANKANKIATATTTEANKRNAEKTSTATSGTSSSNLIPSHDRRPTDPMSEQSKNFVPGSPTLRERKISLPTNSEGRRPAISVNSESRKHSAGSASSEGRKKSSSTTREGGKERTRERTGRSRAGTTSKEKESDKIWPNAASHWKTGQGSLDSGFGTNASPLKAALEANEGSGLGLSVSHAPTPKEVGHRFKTRQVSQVSTDDIYGGE